MIILLTNITAHINYYLHFVRNLVCLKLQMCCNNFSLCVLYILGTVCYTVIFIALFNLEKQTHLNAYKLCIILHNTFRKTIYLIPLKLFFNADMFMLNFLSINVKTINYIKCVIHSER